MQMQICYTTKALEASYKLLRCTIHVIHVRNNKHLEIKRAQQLLRWATVWRR